MKNGESLELLKPAPSTGNSKHKIGDVVDYSGPAYYSSFGGTSVEISGTYVISDILEDESRPYRIRLGTVGWVPYDF